MNHLSYDAFNGSLVEQDLIHVVGNEEPLCETIKKMPIGDIRPQEVLGTKIGDPQATIAPNSADISDMVVPCLRAAVPRLRAAVPPLCRQ